MAQITNELDFDAHEHVWTVRVPFEEYEHMPTSQRLTFTNSLRLVAKSLDVVIEAS